MRASPAHGACICMFVYMNLYKHACVGISVCVYVDVCVYFCVCVFKCVHMDGYVCTEVCVNGCIWLCVYMDGCIYRCMCIWMGAHTDVCVHGCVCTCTRVYMHACTSNLDRALCVYGRLECAGWSVQEGRQGEWLVDCVPRVLCI